MRRLDRETFGYFVGAGRDPMALSKRWPMVTAVNWLKAVFSPSYARAVARWIEYRVELYDGSRG